MAADVRKILQCSTGHVTEEVRDWLNEQGKRAANADNPDAPAAALHMARHTYGWLVWVYDAEEPSEWTDDETPQAIAECLVPIFRHAKKHGCEWINFDCDATPEPSLPLHEW